FERTALVAAVAPGPGHADPAALRHLARELGIGRRPVAHPLLHRHLRQVIGEKGADFAAQALALGWQVAGADAQAVHAGDSRWYLLAGQQIFRAVPAGASLACTLNPERPAARWPACACSTSPPWCWARWPRRSSAITAPT